MSHATAAAATGLAEHERRSLVDHLFFSKMYYEKLLTLHSMFYPRRAFLSFPPSLILPIECSRPQSYALALFSE